MHEGALEKSGLKELDHFSVVRNANVQFPCEICRSHVFLLFVICINIGFCFLCPIGPFVLYSMCPKEKRVHPRTQ